MDGHNWLGKQSSTGISSSVGSSIHEAIQGAYKVLEQEPAPLYDYKKFANFLRVYHGGKSGEQRERRNVFCVGNENMLIILAILHLFVYMWSASINHAALGSAWRIYLVSSIGFSVCTVAFGLSRIVSIITINVPRYALGLVLLADAAFFALDMPLECILFNCIIVFLTTSFNILFLLTCSAISLVMMGVLRSSVTNYFHTYLKQSERANVWTADYRYPACIAHLPPMEAAVSTREKECRPIVLFTADEFRDLVFVPLWAETLLLIIFIAYGICLFNQTLKHSYLMLLSSRYLEGALVPFHSLEVREKAVCELAEDEIAFFNRGGSIRRPEPQTDAIHIPVFTSETPLEEIPIHSDTVSTVQAGGLATFPAGSIPFAFCYQPAVIDSSLLKDLQRYLCFHIRRDNSACWPIFTDFLSPPIFNNGASLEDSTNSGNINDSCSFSALAGARFRQRPPEASMPPQRSSVPHASIMQFLAESTKQAGVETRERRGSNSRFFVLNQPFGRIDCDNGDSSDNSERQSWRTNVIVPTRSSTISELQDAVDNDLAGAISRGFSTPLSSKPTCGDIEDPKNVHTTPTSMPSLNKMILVNTPEPDRSITAFAYDNDGSGIHPFETLLIDCVANTLVSHYFDNNYAPELLTTHGNFTGRAKQFFQTTSLSVMADIAGQGHICNNNSRPSDMNELLGTATMGDLTGFYTTQRLTTSVGGGGLRGNRTMVSSAKGESRTYRSRRSSVTCRTPQAIGRDSVATTIIGGGTGSKNNDFESLSRFDLRSEDTKRLSSHATTSFSDMRAFDESTVFYSSDDEEDLLLHFVTGNGPNNDQSRVTAAYTHVKKVLRPYWFRLHRILSNLVDRMTRRICKFLQDFTLTRSFTIFTASNKRVTARPQMTSIRNFRNPLFEQWYCEWLQAFTLKHWQKLDLLAITVLQIVHVLIEFILLIRRAPIARRIYLTEWSPFMISNATDVLTNGIITVSTDVSDDVLNSDKSRTILILLAFCRILSIIIINGLVIQYFTGHVHKRKIARIARVGCLLPILHFILAEIDYGVAGLLLGRFKAVGHCCVSTTIYGTLVLAPIMAPGVRLQFFLVIYTCFGFVHLIISGCICTNLTHFLSLLGIWCAFAALGLFLIHTPIEFTRRDIFNRNVLPYMIVLDNLYEWVLALYTEHQQKINAVNSGTRGDNGGDSFHDDSTSHARASFALDGHPSSTDDYEAPNVKIFQTTTAWELEWCNKSISEGSSAACNRWEDYESDSASTPRVMIPPAAEELGVAIAVQEPIKSTESKSSSLTVTPCCGASTFLGTMVTPELSVKKVMPNSLRKRQSHSTVVRLCGSSIRVGPLDQNRRKSEL